jgi:hypothetical protein
MFKILKYLYLLKEIYKMQYLEGSGTPVLYIGRKVLKGYNKKRKSMYLFSERM